ncbi:MAG: pyrroloquinoline quinone-dependent dehydrogenase [Vulcanimicrobiaceae bacterium]
MYFTTGPDNGVYALDAASGVLRWHYVPKLGRAESIFSVNRGVAVASGRVFYATLDDHLIALDAQTGKKIWESRIGNPSDGLSEDAAPLAWAGLVFVGSAGNEFGVRGSYSAYSQQDGKLVWRWWAVSPGWEGTFRNTVRGYPLHRDIRRERASRGRFRDAWKTGGGAVWMTPALGPQESTIYLSTGNPAPAFNGDRRPGDNLYTDSVVALDARSGKMKWYYQETPHDVWDYDASSPPVLVDALDAAGRRVPAVVEAGKTGWLYVLDRRTGRLLRISEPFVPQPRIYEPLTRKGTTIQPANGGGAIGPIAYDPAMHVAFVAGNVEPEIGQTFEVEPWRAGGGEGQWKAGAMTDVSEDAHSLLSAIDVDTGRIRWVRPVPSLIYTGGPLSINGLVFLAEQSTGRFKAYDAASGKVLWQVTPGSAVLSHFDVRDRALHVVSAIIQKVTSVWRRVRHHADDNFEDNRAPPVAYRADGREYIVVVSDLYGHSPRAGGDTVFAFALPR